MNFNVNLTEEQLLNVRHVVFGNQKQASVQIEAVVQMIAIGITEASNEHACDSEESFAQACADYLQTLIDNNQSGNIELVCLLAGVKSLEVLNTPGPKVLKVDQPNPESPKYTFRVYPLGQVPESMDVTANVSTGMFYQTGATDNSEYTTEDMMQYAIAIKDNLLKICPDAIKKELSDNEWAQALVAAHAMATRDMWP